MTYTFPLLKDGLGIGNTFWAYAAICAAGLVFILFRLPETKGKTLEQIERELVAGRAKLGQSIRRHRLTGDRTSKIRVFLSRHGSEVLSDRGIPCRVLCSLRPPKGLPHGC